LKTLLGSHRDALRPRKRRTTAVKPRPAREDRNAAFLSLGRYRRRPHPFVPARPPLLSPPTLRRRRAPRPRPHRLTWRWLGSHAHEAELAASTSGPQGVRWYPRGRLANGFPVTGSRGRAAGSGSKATGFDCLQAGWRAQL